MANNVRRYNWKLSAARWDGGQRSGRPTLAPWSLAPGPWSLVPVLPQG